MRYLTESRDRVYVKDYGTLSCKKTWIKVWSVSMDKNFVTAQIFRNGCNQNCLKKGYPKNDRNNSWLVCKLNCRKDYKSFLEDFPRGFKRIIFLSRWNIKTTSRNTERETHITRNMTKKNYWWTAIIIIIKTYSKNGVSVD